MWAPPDPERRKLYWWEDDDAIDAMPLHQRNKILKDMREQRYTPELPDWVMVQRPILPPQGCVSRLVDKVVSKKFRIGPRLKGHRDSV